MIEPLRLSYEIDCPPEHAFDVWTTRLTSWWPRGHSASGDPGTTPRLEPGLGGRLFERTADGTEIDWGEITVWEPPTRLGYLWHIAQDRGQATDVQLTFVDLGHGRTRLDIVHSGWEALGDEALQWRKANTGGWNGLIPSFLAAATTAPTALPPA